MMGTRSSLGPDLSSFQSLPTGLVPNTQMQSTPSAALPTQEIGPPTHGTLPPAVEPVQPPPNGVSKTITPRKSVHFASPPRESNASMVGMPPLPPHAIAQNPWAQFESPQGYPQFQPARRIHKLAALVGVGTVIL